jgi:hypothetical protein
MSGMNKLVQFASLLVAGCWLLVACNSNYTAGKKKGYFKIDFPEKKYQIFDQPVIPTLLSTRFMQR